jgi:16S rRNA (cytosine967-C5)-methyltransferase
MHSETIIPSSVRSAGQSARERGSSDRALDALASILARWQEEQDRTPLDRAVGAILRSRRDLNSRERRWVSNAVFDIVRLLRRQRHLLQTLGIAESPATHAALWASLEALDIGPQALPSSLAASPLASPEALRAALDALPGPAKPADYLRTTLSFPDRLAADLQAELGKEAIAGARALNTQAPAILRVNTLLAGVEQVRAANPSVERTRYSPWGLTLPARTNVYDLPGFRAGWFEVQEEASQLAVLASDVKPGNVVVDVGAGAGGKTLALAALMENKGRIVAVDTSEARLEALSERAVRDGVTCAEIAPIETSPDGAWKLTGHGGNLLKALAGSADCVFVDAPCTGSGVLRRSPDLRWREVDREELSQLQMLLLTQAARLVRPGGVLIYVTCAFERSQNEEVISAFLRNQPSEFVVDPVLPRLERAIRRAAQQASQFHGGSRRRPAGQAPAQTKWEPAPLAPLVHGPYLRTWPHRQGLDAFFTACLRRSEGAIDSPGRSRA